MVTRVLVDANVLYSRTLRDWLFLLKLRSEARIFTVASTVDIIAEAVAPYRDRNPSASGVTVSTMHDRIVESLDERVDHFNVDGSFPGADNGDAHVDAAARACGAGILLTCDTGWGKLTEESRRAQPLDPNRSFPGARRAAWLWGPVSDLRQQGWAECRPIVDQQITPRPRDASILRIKAQVWGTIWWTTNPDPDSATRWTYWGCPSGRR